jgi:hypothetical protein
VDIETIDQRYAQLEAAAQQVAQAFTALAGKLSAAAQTGDQNAREWILDLKEIALQVKDEQDQASNLCQAMHDFVVNNMHDHDAPPAAAQPEPQPYVQQQPYAQPAYGGYGGGGYGGGMGGGGMLQRFMGGGFGRAMAMGAGFGLGDDLINKIF